MTWITPHTSCRYVVGIHHGAPGTKPRTLIAAVHAIEPEPRGAVLASRVLGSDEEGDPTHYAMAVPYPGTALTAFAPNLGEARKLLRALLEAGGHS